MQVRKVLNFEKIRPKLYKTIAYKETSALHMFRLPKVMAHTGAMAQSLRRTEKTLHKLAIAVSMCKAMNHEKLKLIVLLCKAELSKGYRDLFNGVVA